MFKICVNNKKGINNIIITSKSLLFENALNNNNNNNNSKRYLHVDGCFNIEKMQNLMDNSSSNINNNNNNNCSISMIKNRLKGPLSLNDLENFNENGFLIKSNIIINNNNNNNNNDSFSTTSINESNINLYESLAQLYQITYSNSFQKTNNNNNNIIEYTEYPNIYNNFSPTDLIINNDNNNNSNNTQFSNNSNDKYINLDCNPFNLFKIEILNKDKIIESVPLKKWIPIRSYLNNGSDDEIEINLIPKFHKKSIKFISDKYLKDKINLSKKLNRSLNSTNQLFKYDKELLSKFKSFKLKKGDLFYYDSRLPYSITTSNNSNNSNNNNQIIKSLNFLIPNISINKIN